MRFMRHPWEKFERPFYWRPILAFNAGGRHWYFEGWENYVAKMEARYEKLLAEGARISDK